MNDIEQINKWLLVIIALACIVLYIGVFAITEALSGETQNKFDRSTITTTTIHSQGTIHCSYCKKQIPKYAEHFDIIDHTGKDRRICNDCLIKAFDDILGVPNS